MEKKLKSEKLKRIVIIALIILLAQMCSYKYSCIYATDEETNDTETTEEAQDPISIKNLKITVDTTKKTYTGKAKKPTVTIYNGKEKLVLNTDYTVTYKNNTNTGKATVVIQGIGDYTGTVNKSFYIVPKQETIKSVLFNSKGTQATITWNKDTTADGYDIFMSTSKTGTYTKIKTISDNTTTSFTKKSLSSSKTYYFKVRAFIIVNGTKYSSYKYSAVKTNTGLLAKVTLSSSSADSNRNTNLKLASAAINGTVIKSGKNFNWFNVVGQATKAKGYKLATVFENGKTSTGYGGGICQVSTTLYQAAVKANLKIVERHTHSLSVSYAKKGEDATVSYGSKNLIIKNNKSYSIKLVTYSNKTTTTCEIYRVTD